MDLHDLESKLDGMGRGARSRLAGKLGIDVSTVAKIISGKRLLKLHEAPIVEEFLAQRPHEEFHAPAGMAPLFGYVAAAGETISLEAQDIRKYVPRHPAQADYPNVGVAEVLGESMYPRYKSRELVYFVFDLRPRRGDDAIIQLQSGSAILKEYEMQKDNRTFLKEYHPEERQFSMESTGLKLHAVVGRG